MVQRRRREIGKNCGLCIEMAEEPKEIIVNGVKYMKDKKIGGGSFGDIYLATNVQTHQLVVFKIVSREMTVTGGQEEVQEAAAAVGEEGAGDIDGG
jgi:hypothetical protein